MPVASATRELPSVGFFVDILYEVGEVPLYSWFTQWSWGADSSFFLVIASLKIRIPLHITHLKCTIHFFFVYSKSYATISTILGLFQLPENQAGTLWQLSCPRPFLSQHEARLIRFLSLEVCSFWTSADFI